MPEEKIGIVTRYFSKIGVGIVELTSGALKIGDEIHFKGHTTDFTQKVESMEVENQSIKEAKKGDEFGLKVDEKVRINDNVFKIV